MQTLVSLYQLLCADHLQVQGIVDTTDEPVILLDRSLSVVRANAAFLRTFAVEKEETVGVSLFALGNGQWNIPELRHLLGDVIPKSQAVVGFEVNHDFPSIGRRTMLISARRLVQADEDDVSLFVAFNDVTEDRKAAQETDLLLAETRHRIKNILAVVHAIAHQTQVKGRSAEEYRDAYLSRLDAFLSTEDLIAQSGDAGVTLAGLVDAALRSVHSDHIEIHPGPAVHLDRAQVRPLRMILHELTTNAFKYGALSRPDGTVHVTWKRIGDDKGAGVQLDWREERGPPVTPPADLGFGVTMIQRSARVNGGKADVRFEPDGLQVEVLIRAAGT